MKLTEITKNDGFNENYENDENDEFNENKKN